MKLSSKQLNRILGCKTLDELCDAMNRIKCLRNSYPEETIHFMSFPVFGGTQPRGYSKPGYSILSWDANRLLMKNFSCGGWRIVPRSYFGEDQ